MLSTSYKQFIAPAGTAKVRLDLANSQPFPVCQGDLNLRSSFSVTPLLSLLPPPTTQHHRQQHFSCIPQVSSPFLIVFVASERAGIADLARCGAIDCLRPIRHSVPRSATVAALLVHAPHLASSSLSLAILVQYAHYGAAVCPRNQHPGQASLLRGPSAGLPNGSK